MIASYKYKFYHICSSPTKKLLKTKHQSYSSCSSTFTSNPVLIPILMSSRTSDLVSILTSIMSKCGLRLSMHLFLAK